MASAGFAFDIVNWPQYVLSWLYGPQPTLPPISRWVMGSIWVVQAIGFAFPERKILRTAITLFLFYWAVAIPLHADRRPGAYTLGMDHASAFLRTTTLFWLTEAGSAFQKVNDPADPEDQTESSLFRRLQYGFTVTFAYRGVGCRHQIKGLPPGRPRGYSRSRFAFECLRAFIWYWLAHDVIDNYHRYGVELGIRPAGSLHNLPFFWTMVEATFMMYDMVCAIDGLYYGFGLISMLMGISSPHLWPPLFGSPLKAWSVRRFWSHTWHQTHRNWFQTAANVTIHDVFGLRKGSFLSTYGKILVAFFCSFLFHYWGAFTSIGRGSGEWTFFMGQVVMIVAEEKIVDVIKYLGLSPPPKVSRVVGYVWTWIWMWHSWGMWHQEVVDQGSLTTYPFERSIVGSLLKRAQLIQ